MEYEYEGNNNKEKKESIELTDMEINVNNKNDNLINNNESKKKNLKKRKSSFFVSLKYPSLRYKFLILCILWFGTRLISNCIALNSKALPGNYYFNIILLFTFESLAYYVSGILINIKFLGRKGTLYVEYMIIILGFLLLSFFKFPLPIELIFNFIIRFCQSAVELVFSHILWKYIQPFFEVRVLVLM